MIDISKKYKTRDGRPVEDITKVGGYIVGALDGFPMVWNLDGTSRSLEAFDLIEVKPPRLVWLNVYDDTCSPTGLAPHPRRFDADARADSNRKHVLCINIDTGETTIEAP